MEEIIKQINDLAGYLHLDPVIVLIVVGSGFFTKRLLGKTVMIHKDPTTDITWKTFIVSFVVGITYLYLIATPRDLWAKYFLSYFLATSFYEMLLKPVVRWITKLSGGSDDKPDT